MGPPDAIRGAFLFASLNELLRLGALPACSDRPLQRSASDAERRLRAGQAMSMDHQSTPATNGKRAAAQKGKDTAQLFPADAATEGKGHRFRLELPRLEHGAFQVLRLLHGEQDRMIRGLRAQREQLKLPTGIRRRGTEHLEEQRGIHVV